MSIIRVSRQLPYTPIPNIILEAHELSFKARGLLCYLLSKPDDWETSTHRLAREAKKDGRASILAAMQELQIAGFAQFVTTKNSRSQFVKHWIIYDYPYNEAPECENRALGKPSRVRFSDSRKTYSGKPNYLVNTDYQEESYSSGSKKNPQNKIAGKVSFPDNFEITENMQAWFTETYPQYDIVKTTDQWRDACLAKDYRYKDWQAAWKNGMHFAHRNGLAARKPNTETFL